MMMTGPYHENSCNQWIEEAQHKQHRDRPGDGQEIIEMKCSRACSKKFRRVVKLVRVEHKRSRVKKSRRKVGRKVTSLCLDMLRPLQGV